jgi:negative regulator of flagellin synthesis FlgM
MMDPIGAKPVAPGERRLVAPVGPVARPASAQAATSDTAARVSSLAETARALAAKPPIDADRVATIRRAVQEGNFPITPATIADRMIALKLNWKPNDPA